MRFPAALLGCFIFVAFSSGELAAQVGDIKLKRVQDGIKGEYLVGPQKLLIEHRDSNSEHLVSRILDSTGQIVVAAIQVPGSVTVMVTDVTLTITVNRLEPEKSTVSELSEGDRRRLEEFSRSDASIAVREVLANILQQNDPDQGALRMGFLVIAMVLGDGPGAPNVQQSARRCRTPKRVSATFLATSSRVDAHPIFMRTHYSATDDCLGCCGPACWGCTPEPAWHTTFAWEFTEQPIRRAWFC